MAFGVGLASLWLLAASVGGCGSSPSDAAGGRGNTDDPTTAPAAGEIPLAWLELRPLDVWAQPLPVAGTRLVLEAADGSRELPLADVVTVGLFRTGAFDLRLSSEDHHEALLHVTFDGTTLSITPPTDPLSAPGLLVGHAARLVEDPSRVGSGTMQDGTPMQVHTAYVGLRHRWFASAGRAARRGNDVELLMDGREAWGRVQEALEAARHEIKVSTWWWQSDFELTRSTDPSTSESARRSNTILGLLAASPAHKRVAVGQFWGQDGILSFLNTDAALRARADTPNDRFELMGQANVTEGSFSVVPETFSFGDRVRERLVPAAGIAFEAAPPLSSTMPAKEVNLSEWPVSLSVEAASFHQKFLSIDEDLAFVGGMNFQDVDWDDSDHRVYDPRRMAFSASRSEREDVAAKEELPATRPRKDYMVRIQGPASRDVDAVFAKRWSYLLDRHAEYFENSTAFDVISGGPERPGGIQVQITTTLPEPLAERSVGESWFNAVRAAEHYIFIEDQYWRVPMLAQAIRTRLREVPALKLFVITRPVAAGTDPGCAPTARTDAMFRNEFFKRYALAQLRAFDVSVGTGFGDETDARFVDIDVHSKMLIVDDTFMSVGSANKNNRGILYEAEMNAAIVDRTWVRDARRRILANMLPPGTPPTDDVATWWAQLTAAAAANDAVYARWEAEGLDLDLDGDPLPPGFVPQGFLYSLAVASEGTCTIRPVGDDMVEAPPQATQAP